MSLFSNPNMKRFGASNLMHKNDLITFWTDCWMLDAGFFYRICGCWKLQISHLSPTSPHKRVASPKERFQIKQHTYFFPDIFYFNHTKSNDMFPTAKYNGWYIATYCAQSRIYGNWLLYSFDLFSKWTEPR